MIRVSGYFRMEIDQKYNAYLRSVSLFLAAMAYLSPSCAESLCSADESRPNIIFLLSDDQTIGAVGCYGNSGIITPHLDQLAAEGVRFTNHYNTTSICMASRASVMTGLYEYRHGCNFSHGDLERRFMDQAYPVLLRQAGYFTGSAGKIGFVLQKNDFEGLAPMFDMWGGGPGQTFYETAKNEAIAKYAEQYPHCSRAYGAWALDFLKEAKASGKPFCMNISFKAPHKPSTPDPIDLELYGRRTFTPPPNYGAENGSHLSLQSKTSRAATSFEDGDWKQDYDKRARNYYALITGVDAAVGMIREGLQREGLADNTVIIFTSDNGYNCGAHGFSDKVLPYEEGSKSPLIIYDPRLSKQHAGAVCDALTGNVDMAATICSFARVSTPEAIDGRDLRPLLLDPESQVRDALPLFNFWGIESAQSMAVMTQRWKYVYWYFGGNDLQPTEELFNLSNDRFEMANRASQLNYASDLALMRQLYDSEIESIRAKAVDDHGHRPYAILFSRIASWDQKAPLLKDLNTQENEEGGTPRLRRRKAEATERR